MTIGQINAGSSVALTQVAGELAGILAQIQQEQTQASAIVANGQGEIARGAAQSTINAAKDQVKQMVCDIAMAGVEVATSGFTAVASLRSSCAVGAEKQIRDEQFACAKKMESSLTPRVDVTATTRAPTLDELRARSASRTTLKDIMAKHKLAMKEIKEGKKPSYVITDDHAALLKPEERAELLSDVKRHLGNDNKAGLIDSNYETRVKELQASLDRRNQVFKGMNSASQMVANGAKTTYVNDKAQDEALGQIQQQASQQVASAFQQMVDQRSKIADEIAQILGAKNAAIQAVVSTQG